MSRKILLGILVVLILGIGSMFVTAVAKNKGPLNFVSSIHVDDKKEVAEETQESVKLAPLAKITVDDAKAIALRSVDTNKVGAITDVQIENENGNVVYAVEFTKDNVETDVKIDAGDGKVLLIEDDLNEVEKDNLED